MTTYPIIYRESKIRSLWGLVVIIPLAIALFNNSLERGESTLFPVGVILTVTAILLLFVFLYPSSILELYEDHFVYKKGRYAIDSLWSEVITVAFQQNRMGDVINPGSFFIDTKHGATKLMDLKTLKPQSGGKFNESKFVTQIQQLSGKEIMIGDLSTKRYYPTAYKNINVPIKF